MSNAAAMSGQSVAGAHAAQATKQKPDRRLHMSTLRMLAIAAIVTVFLLMMSFTKAWGERMDRLAEVSSSDVFNRSYTTLTGGQYSPEDLQNARITLFNVWSTTCPPCITELPELEELNHSYPAGEIQVIGILSDSVDSEGVVNEKHIQDANAIIDKAGVTFPNLIMDNDLYAFVVSTIIGTPTTYIVDSNGHVVKMVTGSNKFDNWKAEVDSVLDSLG